MKKSAAIVFLLAIALLPITRAAEQRADLKNISLSGGLEDGKARLVIEALLNGFPGGKEKAIFATSLQDSIKVTRDKLTHNITATLDILQGAPDELSLTITGEGEIKQVTGDGLMDWSVRQETNGVRALVLRPKKTDKPPGQFVMNITAEQRLTNATVTAMALSPEHAALLSGYLKIESAPELDVQPGQVSGLIPIERSFLPESLKGTVQTDEPEPLAFRFQGSAYSLPLQVAPADPESRRVVLKDFKLLGQLNDQTAAFALSALARVRNPNGGTLTLLSGGAALTDLEPHTGWHLRFEQNRFVIVFDGAGDFPIHLKFNAAVRQNDRWKSLDFQVAPSALASVTLRGLAADTQFEFTGAARPERSGADFVSYLPADGAVKLSWQEAAREGEGKLFYAAEMLSQITVSPGLMRQTALLDFKVMQGELSRVELRLRGEGEVTRVQGDQVLAWNVEPWPGSSDRRLVVQFNQPQKDQFGVQVQMQTPLGAFPQTADTLQLRPESATRFAGYFRIINEGAVRLEVAQATGLSQISPEQFPESDATRGLLRPTGSQRFAYRFSGGEFSLRISADQILPELTVAELLAYHLGENDLAIDAEFELDIREAPLRELILHVPKSYALARLEAPGLSDYFLREPADQPDAELRIVYGQPVSGRQLVQVRLERNQPLGDSAWVLPRLEVVKAKSTRGHLAAAADAGFRLTPERTQALTEIATAFFPRKIAGIQAAFRLSDPAWQASLRVERLPQTILADVFHLFSIGEGVAYGSSVMTYSISGAPVSAFKVELSDEYSNVEFTGKDIRSWQKTNGGFVVQLHTPVSGSYTLLGTYERTFKAQGETLTFTGARPLDAQSEQGHTLIISAYQFQVKPADVSAGLLPLEPGEVPSEYRLFFDAPILAAYRYNSRPFNLKLALSPLAQGDSLSQVVDRAAMVTRISKEGQILTDARFFVKNRGNPNFRLALPAGTTLWSATVNGAAVVPVTDGQANLIPLPQHGDPNAVLTIELQLASRSNDPRTVVVAAPIVNAPVMLAEWKFEPDTGQRLVYHQGSLKPAGGVPDTSGFAQIAKVFMGGEGANGIRLAFMLLVFLLAAVVLWRWAGVAGVFKFSARHVVGTALGITSVVIALILLSNLGGVMQTRCLYAPGGMSFLAPVQQANGKLSVEIGNLPDKTTLGSVISYIWPALLAFALWIYGWGTERQWLKTIAGPLGWLLAAWAALRSPNGAVGFAFVLAAFIILRVALPALIQLWRVPREVPSSPNPGSESGASAAAALLLACGLLGLSSSAPIYAAAKSDNRPGTVLTLNSSRNANSPPLAESVSQELRIEEKFALGSAKVHWTAVKGQLLPLIFEPAVVTRISYPTNSLKLVSAPAGGHRAQQLLALETGGFDIELQYQLAVTKRDNESGLVLPMQYGLVNGVHLSVANLDVDVTSPQAVSVQREGLSGNTVATLVLSPVNDAWIGWKPRSRDVKGEKAVFYAEVTQLYVPSAGVIEGAHFAAIRPAQGELSELVFELPAGTTVTDVLDPARFFVPADPKAARPVIAPLISVWRFDPDTRRLRVTLNPAQSRPFAVLIRSQVATGPLPFEQSVGLVKLEGASGQIGLFGIATGKEVQLDAVSAENFSAINLEDFPVETIASLQGQIAGLTLRRAFRYANTGAIASLKAAPVEPDVRVDGQTTVSLGEDRTVLAANSEVEITRAGIFRLSFLLPAGFDVESINGAALSHWTDSRTDAGRLMTLNLKGKTEGRQTFAISLAGPGIRATNAWTVPQLILREASKQRGSLLLVPEQGMRLQVVSREGVTQLDPEKSGIRQKGVLAFRLLQTPWNLTLDLEQVDAWTQVTSLEHATVNEAQVKVTANLQYQIENTGLKAFRVLLPTNAESVRFTGDQVADFLPMQGGVTNGLQPWDIKLHRRIIGSYLLQASYLTPLREKATEAVLRGVQASDVNSQRGFLTVESAGRLQISVDNVPEALQPTEWQSIPRALKQDLTTVAANFAFRLVDPTFQLALKLERHEAAKLLEARVNNITLTSVISDDGIMLTQARLELLPGDKRLLNLTLPKDAQFWFAFVSENGVWPWRESDRILIPLEPQSRGGNQPIPVEIYYTCRIGAAARPSLDLELLAPKFDLPLENLTWRVSLSEQWQVKHWSGSLQLQQEQIIAAGGAVELQTYLQNQLSQRQERTKEAESYMAVANNALQQGDPQLARRSFQAAYGLSTHDAAFNEDARVQLHNVKLQQALVGLNFRQAANSADGGAIAGKLRDIRNRKDNNYTQQDAKDIIDRNNADENAAFMRLAERIIQQQDAAVSSPAAIRASIPEQGRVLTFKRAVVVDKWADLKLNLEARVARTAFWLARAVILALTLGLFAVFAILARSFARPA
jgi:hypothetical protein